jgi:hypothetical protein
MRVVSDLARGIQALGREALEEEVPGLTGPRLLRRLDSLWIMRGGH